MPAKRMAFYLHAHFPKPFSRCHRFRKSGLPLRGFISAPIEGKRAVIKQPQPFFHPLLQENALLFVLGFHQGHGVERAASEKKPMRSLIDLNLPPRGRAAVRFQDAYLRRGFAMPE